MADNVTIKVGLNSSAVKSGLAAVRGQFDDLKKFAGSSLVQSFGAVGLATGAVAAFSAIIDKAGQLNDTAERFGISAESLQRIGNVAEQNGASMEGLAKSMNKLVLSQEKVRGGSKEATQALTDLGLSAGDFINLSAEEAFYKIGDAVSTAEDRGKAYAAVTELMGKSSGELFTTLEMGGKAVREMGDAIGVMSNATVAELDAIGDRLGALTKKAQNFGAELIVATAGLFSRPGAALDWIKTDILSGLGVIDKDETARRRKAAKNELYGIDPDKKKDAKPRRDVEEDAAALSKAAAEQERKAGKVASLRERLAEQERKAGLEALDGEAKINALIEQRALLLVDAAAAADPEKQLEAQIKAGELNKEILDARKKADDEAEKKAADLAAKRDKLGDKQFRNSLEGMTDEEKKAALGKKRGSLISEIFDERDEGKSLDLQGELSDLEKEMAALDGKKKETAKREAIAGDLTRKGLGGIAYFGPDLDPQKRAAKAAEKSAKSAAESKLILERIETNIKEGRWAR